MDRLELFRLLGLPPAGVYITQIQTTDWGRSLELSCLYDPEQEKPFSLVLQGCTKIIWTVLDELEAETEQIADLIACHWQQQAESTEVVIHTYIFELVVNCDSLYVKKGWGSS